MGAGRLPLVKGMLGSYLWGMKKNFYLYRALSKDGKQAAIGRIYADDPDDAARLIWKRNPGAIAIAIWREGADVWFFNPRQKHILMQEESNENT